MNRRVAHASAKVGIFLAALVLSDYVPQAHAANKDDVEDAGDVVQILLPSFAYISTGITRDKEGTTQFTKSLFTSLITTGLGKLASDKLRPQGTNTLSFPSGHTTAAFSGAAFINSRYGWKWGIPAYAGAVFVGYSRVAVDQHFLNDVVAGASVAQFANWNFVTPRGKGKEGMVPTVIAMDNGLGFGIDMAMSDAGRAKFEHEDMKAEPKFRYELIFGPASLQKNEITSPSATGTTFDLDTFDKINDPTVTATAVFSWFVKPRHRVQALLIPFESRDTGQFTQPVSFAGQTFPANTSVSSAWRYYELRGEYFYELVPNSRSWNVGIGGGLTAGQTTIELEGSTIPTAKVQDEVVLPVLSFEVGYRFPNSRRWSTTLHATGISTSDDALLDAGLTFRYQFSRRWHGGAGFYIYQRKIETAELKNDVEYTGLLFNVGYTWYRK